MTENHFWFQVSNFSCLQANGYSYIYPVWNIGIWQSKIMKWHEKQIQCGDICWSAMKCSWFTLDWTSAAVNIQVTLLKQPITNYCETLTFW